MIEAAVGIDVLVGGLIAAFAWGVMVTHWFMAKR